MGDKKKEYEYPSFVPSDETNAAKDALGKLTAPAGVDPAYWEAVQAAMDKINNREKFSYDLNGDVLYQQYKDKYVQQGKMAMQDTMGQAAALTGGYGNSNAIAAGNQAYQSHLNNLNDIIPELQQMAYDRYNQEGQDMLNQYSMAKGIYDTKYGEYSDALTQYNADRTYHQGVYDTLYGRDYTVWNDNRTFDYGVHRDAITDEQWQAAFDAANGTVDGVVQTAPVYKGTTKTGKNYDNGGLTAAQVKELQNKLGVEADGYYGSISSEAAGGLGAKEAYEKYVGKVGNDGRKAVDSIREKAATFKSNDALDAYLTKQRDLGYIDDDEMGRLYDEYEISSLSKRDWVMTDDGGANWLGIDRNAYVKDQYGNEYSLIKLKKALIEEGMKPKEAQDYLKALQTRLGI